MTRPVVADGEEIELRRSILERRKGCEVRLFGFSRLPCRELGEFDHATSYLRGRLRDDRGQTPVDFHRLAVVDDPPVRALRQNSTHFRVSFTASEPWGI